MFQILRTIIFRAPNYWSAFGFFKGTLLLLRLESRGKRASDREIKINIPGQPDPMTLRDRVSDRSIFWQVVVRRQYSLHAFTQEKQVKKAYEQLVAGGSTPVIIDAGGNIGLSARYFADEYPAAKILVIEPEQGNFDLLQQNVAAYGERIVPVNGGIWVRNSRLKIVNPKGGDASFRVEEVSDPAGQGINAFSVEGLLDKFSLQERDIFIVKLDIEGSQSQLFDENTEWLERTSLLYLELDDWLLPWSASSMSFFKKSSQIKSDYLLSGEHVVWLNHAQLTYQPVGTDTANT